MINKPNAHLYVILKNRARATFSYAVATQHLTLQHRVKMIIYNFVLKNLAISNLIKKGQQSKRGITYIQERLKLAINKRAAKREMLVLLWDKLLSDQTKICHGDYDALGFLNEMYGIPNDVKQAVLKYYVNQCTKLHTIAFFQWRLKFSSEGAQAEELKEMIKYRIQHFYDVVYDDQQLSEEQKFASELPAGFLAKPGMIGAKPAMWKIHRFVQVDVNEPYPEEHDDQTDIATEEAWGPSAVETDVYPPGRAGCANSSPVCLYMPRNELLLKLMRACIGIKNE